MPNIIEITDFHAPELDPYARLTQNQLRSRLEPEKGIFIAESQGIEPTQEQLDAAAASYSGSSYGDNFVHQTALQTAVMEWLKTNAVVS